MEIKGKDTYRIQMNFSLSEKEIQGLMLCYQACIGANSTSLYLTLVAEASNNRSSETHQRLCILGGIDIFTFELARQKCEEYNLIQTYVEETESRDNYLYVLKKPLTIESFLRHEVLGRRYMKLVSAKQAEITQSRAGLTVFDKRNYTEITKSITTGILDSWDNEDEVKFNKVKPSGLVKYAYADNIKFDYESFLLESTPSTFPVEARTQENLQLIGELATTYGIDKDTMRIMVGRSINSSTNILDTKLLRYKASKHKPKETVAKKNEYDMSPVEFLQFKQNMTIPVSDVNKLRAIQSDYQLSNEILNVVTEYVLEQSNDRFIPNYAEKIASFVFKKGVKTIEDVKQVLKENESPSKRVVKKVNLPDSFEQNNKEETLISDEKVNELKARLAKIGGKS